MNSKLSRRSLIKTAAGSALLAGIGAPAIVKAQADAIRIGHLTPLTGFLGPLGEYAVMGIKLAAEEVNAAGGVLGRKIELVMEDSINPQTASTKAERLIERDKVVMIIGEISSASGLAIGQVANRRKTVFINTGCNSDALRGASCNPYMFHIEGANSMYVMAVGQYLLRENMVKGKKWFSLTADYAFGHDLLRVAKKFMEANGGQFAAGELQEERVRENSVVEIAAEVQPLAEPLRTHDLSRLPSGPLPGADGASLENVRLLDLTGDSIAELVWQQGSQWKVFQLSWDVGGNPSWTSLGYWSGAQNVNLKTAAVTAHCRSPRILPAVFQNYACYKASREAKAGLCAWACWLHKGNTALCATRISQCLWGRSTVSYLPLWMVMMWQSLHAKLTSWQSLPMHIGCLW